MRELHHVCVQHFGVSWGPASGWSMIGSLAKGSVQAYNHDCGVTGVQVAVIGSVTCVQWLCKTDGTCILAAR